MVVTLRFLGPVLEGPRGISETIRPPSGLVRKAGGLWKVWMMGTWDPLLLCIE